jgi:fanconi-associated nuclease 1
MASGRSLLDFFDTQRPAKRFKRPEGVSDCKTSTHSRSPTNLSDDGDTERTLSSPAQDSEDDPFLLDREELALNHGAEADDVEKQTELEISLPPVRTDQKAIEEYEASWAGQVSEEGDDLDLQARMKSQRWKKGSSSIYVDAFNLALEAVLVEEAHLFNEAEREVFRYWRGLPYESQYLYVS